MKERIFARVVAQSIVFPELIQIHYRCLDSNQRTTGEDFVGPKMTWGEAKRLFFIDARYAYECEKYFAEGQRAFLGNCELKRPTGTETDMNPQPMQLHCKVRVNGASGIRWDA
jgi:hypothetical protein